MHVLLPWLLPLYAVAADSGVSEGMVVARQPHNPSCCPAGRPATGLTGSHTWANFQEWGIEGESRISTMTGIWLSRASRPELHPYVVLGAGPWMNSSQGTYRFATSRLTNGPAPVRHWTVGLKSRRDAVQRRVFSKAAVTSRVGRRARHLCRRDVLPGVQPGQAKRKHEDRQRLAWSPLNEANNVNAIDGVPSGDDSGHEIHELKVPEITRLQEAFVSRMIDTVGDLDNVLWEIGNECHAGSVEWQYHMIRYIKQIESTRMQQHPVGMTGAPIGTRELMASPADWISPPGKQWLTDPPSNGGTKVILVDTDHCDPWHHDPDWVWKNLFRGNQFILMDGYVDYRIGSPDQPNPKWDVTRQTMGQARTLAERIELAGSGRIQNWLRPASAFQRRSTTAGSSAARCRSERRRGDGRPDRDQGATHCRMDRAKVQYVP